MSDSKLAITSVTVSLEVADKSYGDGSSRFVTLTAKTPDGKNGVPLENLRDIVSQSLDMHLACYQSMVTQRFADGIIKSVELNECLDKMPRRLQKVRDFLATLEEK